MKQLVLCSIACFVFFCANAQVPFPTDNAIWVNTEYYYVFNPPNPIPDLDLNNVDNYCVNGQDTTIQSNTYTQVFYCGDAYKGALRDDNGIVYFVPADSVDEYLLYDFNAQVSQVLEDVYVGNHFGEEFMLQDFTVQQIGTEIIGGVSRRVLWADNFRWIEGIGCETGLFMEPWTNISDYEHHLECMSVNGNTLFPTDGTGDCLLTVDVASVERTQFAVYPNPSAGNATLKFGAVQTQATIRVLNSLGQQVDSFVATNTNKVEIDLPVNAGIYFLNVTTVDGMAGNLRIVKH